VAPLPGVETPPGEGKDGLTEGTDGVEGSDGVDGSEGVDGTCTVGTCTFGTEGTGGGCKLGV
jgi:hypothetical protein